MIKLLRILPILLLLTACRGRTLETEAVNQARIAIESGDYAEGSLVLLLGCDALHAQSIFLLHMLDYEASNDLMGMVHAWIAIENIASSDEFIREEAYRFLNATLTDVVTTR